MTTPISTSRGLLPEAEERSGQGGLSEYVTRALATQLEIDRLGDYLDSAEAVNGPISGELRARVYADIAEADTESGH